MLELIFWKDKFEIYVYKIFPPAPCQLFGKTCLLLTFTAVLCRYLFLSLTFPPMVWVGHHSGNSTQCHSSSSPPPSLYHSSFGHRFSKSLFPERLFWASLRWRSGWVGRSGSSNNNQPQLTLARQAAGGRRPHTLTSGKSRRAEVFL